MNSNMTSYHILYMLWHMCYTCAKAYFFFKSFSMKLKVHRSSIQIYYQRIRAFIQTNSRSSEEISRYRIRMSITGRSGHCCIGRGHTITWNRDRIIVSYFRPVISEYWILPCFRKYRSSIQSIGFWIQRIIIVIQISFVSGYWIWHR